MPLSSGPMPKLVVLILTLLVITAISVVALSPVLDLEPTALRAAQAAARILTSIGFFAALTLGLLTCRHRQPLAYNKSRSACSEFLALSLLRC